MILFFALALFTVSYLAFTKMLRLPLSKSKWPRRLFYVSARKSTTDAILLGGLILNLGIMAAVIYSSFVTNKSELQLLSLLSFGIILLHGYFDDKFEITPKAKLFCQLLSVGLFTGALAFTSESFPPYYFIIVGIFGFATLNGSNLLDGLDSMQLKLSSISLLAFAFLGKYFQIDNVFTISLLSLAPLMAFTRFNKEPAKIHMGEIGANTLGMVLLVLSVQTFDALKMSKSHLDAASIAIIPSLLPVLELGISFTRRVLKGKSPFKSDRLHIHHLLTEYKGLSAAGATSLLAVIYFGILQTSILVAYFSPIVAVISFTVITAYAYLRLGYPIWFLNRGIVSKVLYSAKMTHLRKQKLKIINTDAIDDFQLVVTPQYRPEDQQDNIKIAS